LHISCVRFDY